MNKIKNLKSSSLAKKFGWFSAALCVLCCAFPLIGLVAGIGTLTAIGAYLENIAIVSFGIMGTLFAYTWYQKKPVLSKEESCETSCETNCGCHPSTQKINQNIND